MNKINKVIGVLLGVYVFVCPFVVAIPWLVHRIPLGEMGGWVLGTTIFLTIGLVIFFWVMKIWLAPVAQLLSCLDPSFKDGKVYPLGLERKERISQSLIQEAVRCVYRFPFRIPLLIVLIIGLSWLGSMLIFAQLTPLSNRTIAGMLLYMISVVFSAVFAQFFPWSMLLIAPVSQVVSQEAIKMGIETQTGRMSIFQKILLSLGFIIVAVASHIITSGYFTGVEIGISNLKSEARIVNGFLSNELKHQLQEEKLEKEAVQKIIAGMDIAGERRNFLTDKNGQLVCGEQEDIFPDKLKRFNKELIEGLKSGTEGVIYDRAYERAISYSPIFEGRYVLGTTLYFSKIKEFKDTMMFYIVFCFGVAVLFLLPLCYALSASLSKAAAAVSSSLKELASQAGDLTKRIGIMTQDELGEATNWLNKFIDTLQKMIAQIRTTADKVSASSQGLSSSAQQVNASTTQISGVIQQISKGTATQAERVEAASKIMQRMADSIRQMVSQAQIGASGSERAAKRAQEGGEVIEGVVQGMNRISEVVTDSAGVVQSLGVRSQQIGEITDAITKIADQTNLLALNAAIEAARAGEAGRGFAVVAEEVRKLAEGSATAATKIGSLIKGIQTETQQAITSMQTGITEVTQGKEIVDKAKQAFAEIVKMVQQTAQVATQASVSIGEQFKGTEEVVKSINEIAIIAEQSSTAAQEASSSTEEMTASMEEMAASSQELAQMAVSLRDLVAKFKLEEE